MPQKSIQRPSPLPFLLFTLLAAIIAGCAPRDKVANAPRDKVIDVGENDPEMNAAIAKARSELPLFWQVFEKRERGESNFSVKVEITDENGTEYFWATDIERNDGKTTGIINNDPNIVANVKMGDRIEIPETDIADWLYMRDDKMVGNHTLTVLFKQMPPDEVRKYKEMMADP